jgi:hypothetical protein
MRRFLAALLVLSGIALQTHIIAAQTPRAISTFDASGILEECDEVCHRWLMEQHTRAVTANLKMPFSGQIRRVQYAADWALGEACPDGRVEIARSITGYKSGGSSPL